MIHPLFSSRTYIRSFVINRRHLYLWIRTIYSVIVAHESTHKEWFHLFRLHEQKNGNEIKSDTVQGETSVLSRSIAGRTCGLDIPNLSGS
jgi:hypothetical protein